MSTSTAPVRPTRITATLASESTKLFGLRATRRLMLTAVLVAGAVSALFCLTMESTTGIGLAQRSVRDVVTTSLLGADAAALTLLVLSAGTMGSEYASGMIRTTLTATPQRTRFLVARAAVIALVTAIIGLLAAFLAFGVGQLLLVSAGLETANLTDPGVLRLLCGSALMSPVYALTALAFAIVFRTTSGGIVATLVVIFLPTLVSWLPEWFRAGVLPYLPGEALHSLSGLTTPDKAHYTAPLIAMFTLVVWVVGMLAVARARLANRDT